MNQAGADSLNFYFLHFLIFDSDYWVKKKLLPLSMDGVQLPQG